MMNNSNVKAPISNNEIETETKTSSEVEGKSMHGVVESSKDSPSVAVGFANKSKEEKKLENLVSENNVNVSSSSGLKRSSENDLLAINSPKKQKVDDSMKDPNSDVVMFPKFVGGIEFDKKLFKSTAMIMYGFGDVEVKDQDPESIHLMAELVVKFMKRIVEKTVSRRKRITSDSSRVANIALTDFFEVLKVDPPKYIRAIRVGNFIKNKYKDVEDAKTSQDLKKGNYTNNINKRIK